jgi:LCP family protein required for cell wall assembly
MVIIGAVLLAALVAVPIAGLLYLRRLDAALEERRDQGDAPEIETALAEEPEEPGWPVYVLLLGTDAGGGDARADTIVLARISQDEGGGIDLLSIPRDAWVPIPGLGEAKVNRARVEGGPTLMIETVRELTGVPITHYIEVDFEGFKQVVDAVGGVHVDVPRAIYDPYAARVDRRRVAASSVPAGPQVLDGEHALTFVRSRRFPDGDFTRMEHQQLFLSAFSEQMTSPQNLPRIPRVVEIASQHVTTDMIVSELIELAGRVERASSGGVETMSAPGRVGRAGGQSVVFLDDAALNRMLAGFMAGDDSVDPSEPAAGDGAPGGSGAGPPADATEEPDGAAPAYPRPEDEAGS